MQQPKQRRLLPLFGVISSLLTAAVGYAQDAAIDSSIAMPPVMQHRTAQSATVPYTAAELRQGLMELEAELNDESDILNTRVSNDSARQIIYAGLRRKAASSANILSQQSIRGVQADAAAYVVAVSGDTSRAKQLLAQRLTEPNLSLADSAQLYLSGVRVFTDERVGINYSTAETYQQQLDRLPSGAGWWQFRGHAHLALKYYDLGQDSKVLQHGKIAFGLLPQVSFLGREQLQQDVRSLYLAFVDLLHKKPNGMAELESLKRELLALAEPSKELITQEPSYVTRGRWATESAKMFIEFGDRLWKPMPVTETMAWINMPDTGARPLLFNDGKVRVVAMVGSFYGLAYVVPWLVRVAHAFPDVVVVARIQTTGVWANIFVSPAEEIAAIRRTLTPDIVHSVPISIWAGAKFPTADGGSVPASDPLSKILPSDAVAVTDGQGRIRRIFMRPFGRDGQTKVTAALERLLREERSSTSQLSIR